VGDSKEDALKTHISSLEGVNDINSKLLEVAQSKSVFGEPVERGEFTIVPAAEVFTAVGVGYGFRAGGSGRWARSARVESGEGVNDTDQGGGGGGGGGTSNGRPVAVISIGPEGVEIKPVIDLTKIGLALLTTLGSMVLMFLKTNKRS
jgi:uncharacterized spore protein YtfJ